MSLVSYSPWTDAAQYGQGLASTLGQIFLGLPKQRFEMAQQASGAPLQRQLLEAQVQEAQARPKLAEEERMFRENEFGERMRHDKAMEQARDQTLQQQITNSTDKGEPNIDQLTKQGNDTLNTFGNNLAAKQGLDKNIPVTIDPHLSLQVIDKLMKDRKNPDFNPQQDALQLLTTVAPILAPLLSTNMQPQVVKGPYPWSGSTTNMVPNVTTNAFQMSAPSIQQQLQQGQPTQQQSQPTATAVNAQGQRIGLVNGQWVPLQ